MLTAETERVRFISYSVYGAFGFEHKNGTANAGCLGDSSDAWCKSVLQTLKSATLSHLDVHCMLKS